ncbi:response regulator [Tateyamaria omphalii]|uniref:hybrid sensor histidine kinase/response regulator n=1 Tax=Tateyamaria omphalii TaxID=299262 RepID=UPI001C996AF9|nr:ATP-binding protein [Tateyamaria omphalii]MBY5931708.1 response regulator [Tateyamaria omphalii]
MTIGLNRYRIVISAGFGLLILLLAVMVANLAMQMRNLSLAAGDNTQWSIAQLDTEFANLNAILTDQLADRSFSEDEVQLRIDIALSRLDIINSGRAAAIFGDSVEAAELIAPINAFADATIPLLDKPGPLNEADMRQIQQMVRDVRLDVRGIALLGVRLGAEQSQTRRAGFARQLLWTGGVAIGLLILMGILLQVLVRLLDRAAQRDRELLTSSKKLASTVAASLDAIVTSDEEGRIIGFNEAAEGVFGWRRKDIIGQKMDDTIIPHRMREAHRDGMERYLKTNEPRVVDSGRFELAALRKSGEEFPVELNITTTDVAGQKSFIAYVRDISERKINEQKLIDARDRAQTMDKAKTRFLAIMSHEIRTPLNGILGVLDLLKTTSLTQQQERYAKIATASSEILLEYVNEALDITRIEGGALQFSPQDFDLVNLMTNLVDVLDPLAREKQLALSLHVADGMRMCFHGDNNRIRQILTNLIGNAIKFTDSGAVKVSVTGIHGPATTSVRFAVCDTGAGIAPDDQEHVFEDFVSLAQGAGRQSRGDGLGLSIARRIAREMGGDITLDSQAGAGSTFTLILPLHRCESQTVEAAAVPEDVVQTKDAYSVLIAEDNDINRKVLRDMLEGMGLRVEEAVNGADCLDKTADERFDLIFMDISMPVMGGVEATEKLRAGGGPNADTQVVGLTAHGKEEYRDTAERAGMNRFHTKPIRLDALRTIFAELNEAAQGADDQGLENDALSELIDVLGAEKVTATGHVFFDELRVFLEESRDVQDTKPLKALAAAAHKLAGAAALLGQVRLMPALTACEDHAGDGELAAFVERRAELAGMADAARSAFDKRLVRAARATS